MDFNSMQQLDRQNQNQQGCLQQQRCQKQDGSQHLTNIGKNYRKTLQNGKNS